MPGLNGIQPNEFRYTFFIRGVETHELPNAPIGWEDQLIKWSRSSEFYGMIRAFTVPLEFVLDGAWLLRREYYQYGLAANVILRIDQLNNKTWTYDLIFEGDIDFGSSFNDERDKVTANIMEGGITKQVKAYQNVQYEIPVSGAGLVEIEIPPIKLLESAAFIFLAPLDSDPKADAFTGIQLVNNEIQSSQASVQDVEFEQNSSPDFSTSDKWFFKANANTILTITNGRIKGGAVFLSGTETLKINIIKSDGTILQTIYSETNSSTVTLFEQPFTLTESLVSGEKVFIYLEIVGGTAFNTGFVITEGEMTLDYETETPPTRCLALRAYEVFNRLINKMNDDVAFPTQTFLLNERWRQLTITSGDAIRQLPGAKIKTSFNDFFQSINSVCNVGFGIESGKAVLEDKAYWFKSNLQITNVGNAKTFNLENYEPFIFNSIKVGYADNTYDGLNGREEVNSTQSWTTPITRIQKEFNLLSVYRADPYGIEYLRINLDKKTSTDSGSDNDVFFIKVKAGNEYEGELGEFGYYFKPEGSEVYTSIEGISSDNTYYNFDLTPKQNLLRHGDFLHSFLDKYDGYEIKFQSGLKNTKLKTVNLSSVIVDEDVNINISALPARIFMPYLVTITVSLPQLVMAQMDAKPTGYIKFMYLDNEYTGFIIDASIDISKNGSREFKLLLTPNNNLLNLVR